MHVITAFHLGGAEEVAVNLAIGLAARGHEGLVAAVSRPRFKDEIGADQKDRLSRAGIEFVELGTHSARFNVLYTPWRVLSMVRHWKPDIVHSHTDIPDTMVSLAHRLGQFTVARTIHNSVLWPTHVVMGRIVESAFWDDLVVSVSSDARVAYEELRRKFSLPVSTRQLVIRNGVACGNDEQRLDRAYLGTALSANVNKMQFCFAGRYDRQKGFDVLIGALGGLPQNYLAKFEVHAFGQGMDLDAHVSEVADMNLPVFFHSPIPRISRLFPAFDAVLMPSRFEGLAIVALEALTMGVPVIGTTATGLRESLPPAWPLTVPVEDATKFRAALVDLLDGNLDIEALGKRGQEWARAHYGVDRMVSEYEKAYEQYLNQSKITNYS